jgi:archaellum component FlaG (FlaF/FlaG flagellin family)
MFFIPVMFVNLSCAPMMIEQIFSHVEKMQEMQQKERDELSKQINIIEGEISSAGMIEKEEKISQPKVVIENNITKTSSEEIIVTKKKFLVKFIDGREKEFVNISEKPLMPNQYYIIQYNGLDEITSTRKISENE